MAETIIAALIAAAASLAVSIITNAAANSKNRALIEYKLTELQKTVDKHNNLVERMYKVEEITTLQTEQIKVANHRIDDLEKKV